MSKTICKFVGPLITAFIASQVNAVAWEATYSGRISQPLQELLTGNPQLKSFSQNQVEYPLNEGVQLGQSWDMFLNKKVMSTCVDFKTISQTKYEGAQLDLHEATDEETRDVTLNMNFTIAGGGSYAGYGGKGNSSLTKNSFSHFYSKDVLLVAHASTNNGSDVAVPADSNATSDDNNTTSGSNRSLGFKSIHLLPGMAELDPAEFRQRCGDGFVSTINYGADLYSLLSFHVADKKTRDQLETAAQTSGGFAGFTASASGAISQLITTEANAGRLSIEFSQSGGKIETLPIDLPTLQEKLKKFPKEAWEGPKPTHMIIYPYSALADYTKKNDSKYSTVLEAALRYNRRLQSIHAELLDMQDDYNRERTTRPIDNYYFAYVHRVRSEDLQFQREEIENEIQRTSNLIDALSACIKSCSKDDPAFEAVGKAISSWNHQKDSSSSLQAFGLQPSSIEEAQFDDLKYWIRLPLPLNAITSEARAIIESTSQSITWEQKKQTFARNLYQHWIRRQDSARCRLYGECLNQKQQYDYYAETLKSLFADSPHPLIAEKTLKNPRPFARLLTVAKCIKVHVANSRDSMASNSFSITEVDANENPILGGDKKPVMIAINQAGEQSLNKDLPAATTPQYLLVQGWFGGGGQFGSSKAPMVGSSVHYTTAMQTVVWFQDPGSSASIGPNLKVYLQAVPDPVPGCEATIQELKSGAAQ